MAKVFFVEEWGKALVPKRFAPNLRSYLLKAGFNEVPYKFFGVLFDVSLLITVIIYTAIIMPLTTGYSFFVKFIARFVGFLAPALFFPILCILLIYFFLDLKIYHRTKIMEEQLPDFLQLVSANLKGGMTFERALWSAIKPRFEILGIEMSKASKKVMTGYDVSKALTELSDMYSSLMLKRTVDLVISEVESGGNIAQLIDRIVDNLQETKELKDEMSAAALAYIIFISLIVVVISPLLFALSLHLLTVLISFISKLTFTSQTATPLTFVFSKVNVNPDDFKKFSMIAILVISFFSSLIVSIVEKGDMKGGLKYIPIYTLGSITFYFIFINLLEYVFQGLLK